MLPDASTRLVFLLGYPVEHSLSPWLHNMAFRHQKLNYIYVATPVHPAQLAEAVRGMKALPVAGANVTIPHKSSILPFLDSVSREVEHTGAANTLFFHREGTHVRIHGENTDIKGFMAPLHPYLPRLKHQSAVVFGAGGAARAVLYALVTATSLARITMVARKPARVEELIQYVISKTPTTITLQALPFGEATSAVREATLLVNATPVGMHPHADETIWPYEHTFHEAQIAYDLVYNPLHTRFLQMAASRGATVISGLDMLIEQAAEAYRLWTGHVFPHTHIREALTKRIQKTI